MWYHQSFSEWLSPGRQQITSVGVDVEKGKTCTLLVGKWSDAITMENSIEVSQNVKNWMAIWSSNLTSEDLFKENKSTNVKRYMNSHVCCSAIYSSQKWKQQKDPLTDEWTNKMWCVYQFSLVHSLRHVRPFATTWTAAHQASLSITNS